MKVLVISHNCFSTTQSMGKTLASLLRNFHKEELMQLYLYPSLPNVDICGSYYRISDKDILQSIFKRKDCGRRIDQNEIKPSNLLFETTIEAEKYQSIKRDSLLLHRLRDLVWCFGNWKTSKLKKWLKDGNPEVIFYALGDAAFSQNIAMWVTNYLKIPLVTLVCDEFYFYYKNNTSLYIRLLSRHLVKNIRRVLKVSSNLVVVCDTLGERYKKCFGLPCITIMTGSLFHSDDIIPKQGSHQISYIGNCGLNRWKSIIEIANALKLINSNEGTDYYFRYFGTEEEHLEKLTTIQYGGRLNHEQVKETIVNSDLLVHTEAFDFELRDRLRYSISTKIADSLASGVCLFAYGPKGIASIDYLIENDAAYVITSEEDLVSGLSEIINDPELRRQKVENARKTAERNHDINVVPMKLRQWLQDVVDEYQQDSQEKMT